jgi:DNA-binding transcriptional MerR regulator
MTVLYLQNTTTGLTLASMRTSEIAKAVNVSPGLIRLLDRQGLLGSIPRDRSGHRRFTSSDLDRVRAVVYPRLSERDDVGRAEVAEALRVQ